MRIFKIIFLLILILAVFLSDAQDKQQSKLDSLYSVWQNISKPDSLRVAAMYQYIGIGFLHSQPDSAYELAHQLLHFSKESKNIKGISYGYNYLGSILFYQGQYAKALDYYTRDLKIEKELGNVGGIARTLNNIGNIFYYQGEKIKALDYYIQSLKLKEELGDKGGIASSLNNIGLMYDNQGDKKKALEYYYRSLEIYEVLENKRLISAALHNIGGVYYEEGNVEKAMGYYTRCLKIRKELEDLSGIAGVLNNIALIYADQDDNAKALEYYDTSLKYYQEMGDQYSISETQVGIGRIYLAQGNYKNALDYCSRSLRIAESIGALEKQSDACECLYSVYRKTGQSNEALLYSEKWQRIRDSLNFEETNMKLQQMEFMKQVYADSIAQVEKDRQVQLAHEEEVRQKKRGRNIAYGSGTLALLLAGGFYSRWRYVKRTNKVIREEKDRSENLLLNILPSEIAEELKEKGKADARDFDQVTILFTDFKEFTRTSEKLGAKELVSEINHCFKAFDAICEKYGVEKIKTIGDSFMAAGGLPVPFVDSIRNTVLAGLEMADFIIGRKAEREAQGQIPFEMRVGINTGPVVAGIVGVKKFQYDIWGDTVNTASRMESKGEVGKVNISESTYNLIKDDPEFLFESRGQVEAKGKGMVNMYFVSLK